MNDLKKRVITAIIGLIIVITVLFKGGIFLELAVLLASLISVLELNQAIKKINVKLNLISILFGILSLYILEVLNLNIFISLIIVFFVATIYFIFDKKTTLIDTGLTIMAYIYIPMNLNLLTELYRTPFLYLVFIIAFSTDTFAYLIGSKFGTIKLLESVSPKKSVEGFVGGIIGCLICSILYLKYVNYNLNLISIIFIVLASILGQLGDLFASKIKRICEIKDYSNLLPGHGGMLDRLDSLLFITPLIYCLLNFLNNL